MKGAAVTILSENIMGGACARVCPVEVLCEAACVREAQEEKPVQIGALQRYATDWLFEQKLQPFSARQVDGQADRRGRRRPGGAGLRPSPGDARATTSRSSKRGPRPAA